MAFRLPKPFVGIRTNVASDPVMLTSMTTIAGLLPLHVGKIIPGTTADSNGDQLGIWSDARHVLGAVPGARLLLDLLVGVRPHDRPDDQCWFFE